MAGILSLCRDEVLAKNGYHRISFRKHNFFIVYRIDGNVAIVDGMYHELQDYESTFSQMMHLR